MPPAPWERSWPRSPGIPCPRTRWPSRRRSPQRFRRRSREGRVRPTAQQRPGTPLAWSLAGSRSASRVTPPRNGHRPRPALQGGDGYRSGLADVRRLFSLRAGGDLELHPLPLGEGSEPLSLDLAEVDEDILPALFRDEPEPLRVVEPFYRAECHAYDSSAGPAGPSVNLRALRRPLRSAGRALSPLRSVKSPNLRSHCAGYRIRW